MIYNTNFQPRGHPHAEGKKVNDEIVETTDYLLYGKKVVQMKKGDNKDTSKSSSKPSKKRSKEKSNVKNDYADEVATAGILTLIVAGVWTVAKIAAIPYTGGLSLIVP